MRLKFISKTLIRTPKNRFLIAKGVREVGVLSRKLHHNLVNPKIKLYTFKNPLV